MGSSISTPDQQVLLLPSRKALYLCHEVTQILGFHRTADSEAACRAT
jgi:hypothetical protein